MNGSSAAKRQKLGRGRLLCWAILLTSGVLYGSSFSFMKIAVLRGAKPLGMVLWFALLATCVLGIELSILGRLSRIDGRVVKFCLPWGILSVVLPNSSFFYAARVIQPGIIALAIALVPLLTLTGAILLRRERLTVRRGTGITLGAAAVMMILLPEASLPDVGGVFFVMVAFAGAACYAAEHLYIEARAPQGVAIDQLLFVMFSLVSVLLLPLVLLTRTFFLPRLPLGATEWAIIAVSSVTLLDYFLITLLILWAGPVFTSQAAYIVTIAGVVWGKVIFHDDHSIWVWMAIFVLLCGLVLVRPRLEAG